MGKNKFKTVADFHQAWTADLAPHVPEPIVAVALFNPPGAVAASGAAVLGRSMGGLLGKKLAQHVTAPQGSVRELPAVLAGALTATGLFLLEVEPTADHTHLHVVGGFAAWNRSGLRVEVARKVMSERLTFTLADGRQVELDGMFVGRCKDRPYQQLVDLVRG